MIYNVEGLRKDTVELIREIDTQIEHVKPLDPASIPATLAILLNAKATAYNTLVTLQSQERVAGRTGPPRRQ